MEAQPLFFCLCFLFLSTLVGSVYGDDLQSKCANDVTKVMPCLNFAKGQATTPTKECCDAASELKDSEPECLCYMIHLTDKGDSSIKSLGIQKAKLLQLPSACNIKTANISDCPRLLNLPAGSPDAAIFTNVNASTLHPSPTTSQDDKSYGSRLRSHFTTIFAVAFATVFVAITTGFTFCI